jgi:hypothetical protein
MKLRCTLLLTLALQAAAPAIACGLHGGGPDLAIAHPRSLDLAFALSDAYRIAELQALEPVPPILQLMRSQKTLRTLLPRLAELTPVPSQQRPTLALLLVESGLWSRVVWSEQGLSLQQHVAGPLPDEPVLLSSEAVLSAIAAEQLSPARASALGLLIYAHAERQDPLESSS